ncbi:FKBP-type peptidyl-prolyl cis-trans isomerase [Flavobacterium fluviatile]|uniref:FKBP-type peptidyl-prolyl cis-trans isomerase n=1 Tax=Flavobacterium fluviatile TaxID=1862387 RepID=UPI0013D55586|nr:FKBP-type peptidyl-prolyl cis-trans isomerase [Flavobacterium fluviatile]
MRRIISILVVFTFFSCLSPENEPYTPPKDFTSENEKEITDYIAKNNLTAQKTSTGLYYVINEPGEGIQPTASSNVTVIYKGYYTNGTVFDPGKPEGVSFGLNEVIRGWTEGIPYFKTGGSGILLIPSHLGYGPDYYRGIPGGSVLVFDVKLISVNN